MDRGSFFSGSILYKLRVEYLSRWHTTENRQTNFELRKQMQQSRSSVRIKTAKVEEQCCKMIKLINEKRTQEDVAVENAHLEKINRRLWRRLRGWLEREYLTNKEKLSISK